MHVAWAGRKHRGVLLIRASGAGKSGPSPHRGLRGPDIPTEAGTSVLSLHCALRGLDFLTEDAPFVVPETMLATGVSNFLHVKADSLRFLHDAAMVSRIQQSPVIRRRSGVEKFELDMRRLPRPPARKPLALSGI